MATKKTSNTVNGMINKNVNIYTALIEKDGQTTYADEVRSSCKAEAARLIGCFVSEVKLIKLNVKRTLDEIVMGIHINSHPAAVNQRVEHAKRYCSPKPIRRAPKPKLKQSKGGARGKR